MDRKGIIAVILSLAVLVWWQFKTQKEIEAWRAANPIPVASGAATPAPSDSTTATPSAATTAAAAASPASPAPATAAAATPEPAQPEQLETVATDSAVYTFTNHGGGIAKLQLLNHQGAKAEDDVVLNEFGKHPLGAVLYSPSAPQDENYTISRSGNQIIAERTSPAGVKITKTYKFPEAKEGGKVQADEYTINLDVAFTNTTGTPLDQPSYYLFAGSAGPIHPPELEPTIYTGFGWGHGNMAEFIDAHWFEAGMIPLVGIQTSAAKSEYTQAPGDVSWAGVRNQYFTSILSTKDGKARGVWAEARGTKVGDKEAKGVEGALEMPGTRLNPGQTVSQSFTVYAGPKEYRRLKQLGHNEAEIMQFGWFKLVSIFLLRSMNLFHDWLGGYAVAIIVLTFIVRGALWPIQGAATKSMKRMQLIQPHMEKLRTKYKDDPTRMNQELMKLYKDYKINPFGGCLPMLIQIPIFFGFYQMLGTAVELRNSSFFWVHDLSRPDTIFHIAGFPVNILPLLMAGTMVWQMALTPQTGDPMQRKIMMFMPLIFVGFTYNFASALALYYTVQNILSIFQLWVTRDQPMPALEKVKTGKTKR